MAPGEGEGEAAKAAGFSLHAGISTRAHQRSNLERLCRYVTRPAVSTQQLSLTRQGDIRYTLTTPYRDGTTHVVFEPLGFVARLAAQVPHRRVNLTRFHGIFAPNSRWRAQITPAGRDKRVGPAKNVTEPELCLPSCLCTLGTVFIYLSAVDMQEAMESTFRAYAKKYL